MKSLSLNQPHLLITVGIPGSGKTFFAEKFAGIFGAPYVKYDTIMDISGQNPSISDSYTGYLLRQLFKTKHTIVFDGPASTRAERAALKDFATNSGYACLFIWVQTDAPTARTRFIKDSHKAGRQISADQYDVMVKKFVPPLMKEYPTVVVSGKHTYATQVKVVLKTLASAKQESRIEKTHEKQPISVGSKRNIIVR